MTKRYGAIALGVCLAIAHYEEKMSEKLLFLRRCTFAPSYIPKKRDFEKILPPF